MVTHQHFQRPRASYASHAEASRGRIHPETHSPTRSEYQRDRDRIIHSSAFRRLNYKTQVFVYHEGDHFRTRLTHSLEVSQIARSITRVLGGDDDLAETLALAHDLGHTPFGHTGEEALADAMAEFGGFDHNAQSMRVVTRLERRYADFDGLNLTWETLEGLAKHNGPLIGPLARPPAELAALPHAIRVIANEVDLDLDRFASLEAQIAAISDDIAYNNHDIDDGVRAGLFELDEMGEIELVRDVVATVDRLHPILEPQRRVYETMRRLITLMVEDVITETRSRLEALAPQSADGIRAADRQVSDFSDTLRPQIAALRTFLFAHMYRHPKVARTREHAADIVRSMFEHYRADVERLPLAWRMGLDPADAAQQARRIADFIAGMTDRFAISTFEGQFATP